MMKNILIVEDDFVVRQNMKDLLEWIGYKCAVAENGLGALELIANAQYDLIITDYKMPLLNGLQLINILKKSETTDTIPIILMIYSYESIRFDNGEDEKINLLLTKPVNAKFLVDSIKSIFVN
ncbi:MAG: response regulator [Ignavibacteria bacterium]|jgi:two-component system response regulator (stage 0 sporulation protein F)